MEVNQGLTLDRYLSERGPLDQAQVLRLGIQLAQQMEASSASFPIHPGRILACKDGTVQLLPPAVEDLALPAIVEYPAYASPEQIGGAQPDARTALYSLGCTLFELLVGRPPFSGKDPKDVLRAHVEDPAPDVRQSTLKVSDALAETINELLEKNPDLRIQSSGELIRRLKQASLHPSGAAAVGRAQAAPPAHKGGPGAGTPLTADRSVGEPAAGDRHRLVERGPAGRGHVEKVETGPLRKPGSRGAVGFTGRAPPSRLGGRVGGPHDTRSHQRRRHDDDAYGDPAAGLIVRRNKFYPFSISGAVLGVLIGVVIVLAKTREAEKVPEIEKQKIAEARAEALRNRKASFAAEDAKRRKEVEGKLGDLKKKAPEFQRDFLVESLRRYATYPSAHLLAKALAELGPPPGMPGAAASASTPEDPGVAERFRKQLADAEQLHAEGKLGAAITRVYDNYLEFKVHHGAEIDSRIEQWSKEIEERWKNDKAEIDSLCSQGQDKTALAKAKQALVYADETLRKEIDKLVLSIQDQMEIKRSSEETEEGAEPDLESELDRELKQSKPKKKGADEEIKEPGSDEDDMPEPGSDEP